ncbi:PilN domain-containing protein [Arenimonas sp.]|uniref:PilN domain-containing protein n=1 Tax=Arenimonas sp. TaxID=1872635 RepID=UPI0039E3E0DF
MPASPAFSNAVQPLRTRLLDSPLPGWWDAGVEAVAGLLPQGLRRRIGAQKRALLLSLSGETLRLRAETDRRIVELGNLPMDAELLANLRARLDAQAGGVGRWLLLDPSQVLRRSLTLPSSAEPRLREVLAHEIDRQTPFPADQVVFETRVLGRDTATKQLQVELVVVPRAVLDAQLEALGPLADRLVGVDVADGEGARLGVNLLPTAQRGAGGDRDRWLNRGLVVATVLLLLMAMLQVLDNRRTALAEVRQRVDEANKQIVGVRLLRNSLGSSRQAADFLAKKRGQQPTMLELLADLTRRIPDGTSLEKLAVNQGKIVMIGQSQEAPALVGLLQGSSLIRTPALAGAVQRDVRTGKDRFTLTANMVGATAEVRDGGQR